MGLRRPGVMLMLLWEVYRAAAPDGYGYSRWRELYRAWEGRLSPTMRPMRQSHPAGERMCGQTVEIIDGRTGEGREARVFVAAMGAPPRLPIGSNCRQRLLPGAASRPEPPAHAGAGSGGGGRSSAIRRRIAAYSILGTATSASWKTR